MWGFYLSIEKYFSFLVQFSNTLTKNDISLWGDPINNLKLIFMSNLLDQILSDYEAKQKNQTQEIQREMTFEEWELLNDHINNDNLQAIYDYYDLKEKLDKEWIDTK